MNHRIDLGGGVPCIDEMRWVAIRVYWGGGARIEFDG